MSEAQLQTVSIPEPARAPAQAETRAQASTSSEVIATLQSLACTIVIAVFVITFIVQAFQIPSESMERTLLIGDYLLVDKAHYAGAGPFRWLLPYRRIERQDIVVFRYPVNPQQHFVKRVIGVPGDRLRMVNKRVYVNGVRLPDDYASFNWGQSDKFRDNFPNGGFFADRVASKWFIQAQKLVDDGQLIVPEDCYFVLGDNRDDSYDSRYWGLVPVENIVGRPLLIYWSMEQPASAADAASASGKLSTLAYSAVQSVRGLRWKRMFRVPN
jgi:signal peptidase I